MGVGKVAPAPEISAACTTLTSATAAVAVSSIRLGERKLMVPLLMLFGILWDRAWRPALRPWSGALDDGIVTLR